MFHHPDLTARLAADRRADFERQRRHPPPFAAGAGRGRRRGVTHAVTWCT